MYKRQVGAGFENHYEAEIVNRILFDILESNNGDCNLYGEIFVSSPYKSQVGYLRTHLQCYDKFMQRYPGLVKVDTVDSLQGRQRRIVVLSMTRSNDSVDVGFLRDGRRINVATSRARNLLVIVGDISTIRGSPMIRRIYDDIYNSNQECGIFCSASYYKISPQNS